MLKIIAALIYDYFLVILWQINGLLTPKPPVNLRGSNGDIILIPGYGESWIFLRCIARYVHSLGFTVHWIPGMGYNFITVPNAANHVAEYIKTHGISKPIIIAHSKGGLVAKYLLDTEDIDGSIRVVITIATPYFGSYLGYLWLCNLHELVPSSPLFAQLHSHTKKNTKIVNILPFFDQHVIPANSLTLPGASNIVVSAIGHDAVLIAKETLDIIQKTLIQRKKHLPLNDIHATRE